jgi:hypothetical protein
MKFGLLTINNLRPAIFRLFCASIRRLRKDIGIEFPVVCVSGSEDEPRCAEYNIHHIIADNSLGWEKWNIGTQWFKTQGIDYIIISGSDDVFSTDALKNIISAMNNDVDLIGFNKIYIYCTEGKYKGQLKVVVTRGILGVGKTLHRRVLESVNWRPWEYYTIRRWGMDAILHRNTSAHIRSKLTVDGIIVDCKTAQSLNKFSMFVNNRHGTNVSSNVFYDILGEEEKQILNSFVGSDLNDYFYKVKR